MDPSGRRCPVRKKKTDIWEMMKADYEDRAASLQAKEEELKLKISQMESLLSNRMSVSCCCISHTGDVPKVFSNTKRQDSPVRDIPRFRDRPPLSSRVAPRVSTEKVASRDRKSPSSERVPSRRTTPSRSPPRTSRSPSPKKQTNPPTTFFQKVMENAKSILTLKCNAVHPPLDDRPTRENDVLTYPNLRQKKSTCSCDFDEESTRNDYTTDSYSQDISNSLCCKNCPIESISTIKSKRTTSVVVNTCSYCNTSTSTDIRAVAEDGSQYTASDYSQKTQTYNMDCCWVCPFKTEKKGQSKEVEQPKKQGCNRNTCSSYLSLNRRLSSPNVAVKNQEPVKKKRSKSQIREKDIQCAFIGSPMLVKADYAAAPPVDQEGDRPFVCASQKQVADLANKEKQMRGQMESLQNREKNYEMLFNDYQTMMSNAPTCCCSRPSGQLDKIDKVSQELRLENKMLKDELMQMKMELKHTLEKVEGPMKSQLETEKMRCVKLEKDLNNASQNMLNNQESHLREMNALKIQLCMACSNINDLNSMNRRLKDEMATLDEMCSKLEDDLMKQKISEAETIKLLTKRKGEPVQGTCPCCSKTVVQEKFSCESNLHIIARKLSKTLRESAPCEECSKLPAELAGAAKCIKDLSDLVQSRKVKKSEEDDEEEKETKKPSRESQLRAVSSQTPPQTADEASQCMEGQRGDEAKTTTVMSPVALAVNPSSEIEMKMAIMEPTSSKGLGERPQGDPSFVTAVGEPGTICPGICYTEKPCLKLGLPCLKVTEKPTEEPPQAQEKDTFPKTVEEPKKAPVESGDAEQISKKSEDARMEPGDGAKIEPTGSEGAKIEPMVRRRSKLGSTGSEPDKIQPSGTEGSEGAKLEPMARRGSKLGSTGSERDKIQPSGTEGSEAKLESVGSGAAKEIPILLINDQPIEKTIEKDAVYPLKATPFPRRVVEPLPCTAPCGSDEPCGKGQPCFIIEGLSDLPKDMSGTAKQGLIEPVLTETPAEEQKFPSDAVIEPPKVSSEVKQPLPEEKDAEKTYVIVEVPDESTATTGDQIPSSIQELTEVDLSDTPLEESLGLKTESKEPIISESKTPEKKLSPETPPQTPASISDEEEIVTEAPTTETDRTDGAFDQEPIAVRKASSKTPSIKQAPSTVQEMAFTPTTEIDRTDDVFDQEPIAVRRASSIKTPSIKKAPSTVQEIAPTPTTETDRTDGAFDQEPIAVRRASSIKTPSIKKAPSTVQEIAPTPITETDRTDGVFAQEPIAVRRASSIKTPSIKKAPSSVQEIGPTPFLQVPTETIVTEAKRIESSIASKTSSKDRTATESDRITTTKSSSIEEPGITVTEPAKTKTSSIIEASVAATEPSTKTKPSFIREPSITIVKTIKEPSVPQIQSEMVRRPSILKQPTAPEPTRTEIPVSQEMPGVPYSVISEVIREEPDKAKPEPALEIDGLSLEKPTTVTRRSGPGLVTKELIEADHPFTEDRTGNFPFEVDTKVEVLDVPPSDLHVTTTITKSGTLEVITEGAEGTIETNLIYQPDGTILVVTNLIEEEPKEMRDTVNRPASSTVFQPRKENAPFKMDNSFFSGTTDQTPLVTVTDSTKDTSYMSSSYASDFNKTMAMDRTGAGSTAATIGSSLREQVPEIDTTISSSVAKPGVTPSKVGSITPKVGSKGTAQSVSISEYGEEVSDRLSGMGEEEPSVTEGTSTTGGVPVLKGVSGAECCEEDRLSRMGVEGASAMECCEAGTETSVTDAKIQGDSSAMMYGEEGEVFSLAMDEMSSHGQLPKDGLPKERESAMDHEGGEEIIGVSSAISGKATDETEIKKGKPSGGEFADEVEGGEFKEKASGEMGEEAAAGTGEMGEEAVVRTGEKGRERADATPGYVSPKPSDKVSGEKKEKGETAQQALTGQKRDCGCQATPQTEQSCQCCECKDVGVSTSRDSETITDLNMVQGRVAEGPQLPDITELESEAQTPTGHGDASQPSQPSQDIAEAIDAESRHVQGTTDDISTIQEGPISIHDQAFLKEDSQKDDYKNKKGKPVQDKGTECACPEETDEESEKVSTTDTAVQCACEGPIETDDRSEGRVSSGSEIDYELPKKKKPETEDRTTSKPSFGPEKIEPVRSKGDDISTDKKKIPSIIIEDVDEPSTGPDVKKERVRKKKSDHEESLLDDVKDKPKMKKVKSVESEVEDVFYDASPKYTKKVSPEEELEEEEEPSQSYKKERSKNKKVKSEEGDFDEEEELSFDSSKKGKGKPKRKIEDFDEEPSVESHSKKEKPKKKIKAKPSKEGDEYEEEEPSVDSSSKKAKEKRKKKTELEQEDFDEEHSIEPRSRKEKPKKKTKREPSKEGNEYEEEDPSVDSSSKKATEKRKKKLKAEQEDFDEEEPSAESRSGKTKKKMKTDEREFQEEPSFDQADKPKKKVDPKKSEKHEYDEKPTISEKHDQKPKIKSKSDTEKTLSSESEYEMPEKTDSLEVPDSAILSPTCTTDSKKPRKKRSSSQKLQSIECDCSGVCQCVICSPKIIAERKALTGSPGPITGDNARPCWCTPPPTAQTQIQGGSKVPVQPRKHPPGCQCTTCLCETCTPCPPQYGQEAFLRSTNLGSSHVPSKDRKRLYVDDIFKPSEDCKAPCAVADCKVRTECQKLGRSSHPLNCECIDCLCFRRIAELKEHPVIRDEKQVYQVKCYCENTKKPVSSSRIPIATNSATGPPKARTTVSCTCGDCKCSPCSDINQASKSQKPPTDSSSSPTTTPQIRITPSELAKLCDCGDCKCAVCYDKPLKRGGQPDSTTNKPKGSKKNCCCKDVCICETCPVELLTASKREPSATPKVGSPSADHPEDCDCAECACPQSKAKTRTTTTTSPRPQDHPEDCDCSECVCPGSKTRTEKNKTGTTTTASPRPQDHPEDCNCSECVCPGSKTRTEKNKTGTTTTTSPRPQDHPEDCDCSECVCPGSKTRPGKKESKTKTSTSKLPVKISKAAVSGKTSQVRPTGCICGDCSCPGKDLALQATGDRSYLPTDCGCSVCSCPGKEVLKSANAAGQSANMPAIPEGPSIADCDCVDCRCNPCADPKKRRADAGPPVINPCDCADCKCDPCADPSKRKDKGDAQDRTYKGEIAIMVTPPSNEALPTVSAGVGPTENRATHPPDCICDECLCKPEEHEPGCTCPECKCVVCFAKTTDAGVHAEGCQCFECICAPCDKKIETPKTPSANLPPDCNCPKCVCPQTEAKKHLENCICTTCVCPEPDAKTTTPRSKDHPEDCNCTVCTCPQPSKGHPEDCNCTVCVCPSAKPKEEEHSLCTCGECTCEDCVAKKGRTEIHGEGCHCPECACKPCKRKGSPAVERPTELGSGETKPTMTENKSCTCGDCKCVDCFYKPKQTSEECTCADCICIDCPKKKRAGAEKGEVTDSKTTKAVEPSRIQPATVSHSCHCIDCLCDVCTKTTADKKTEAKDGLPSSCTCEVCQCEDCGSMRTIPASTGKECSCEVCQCADCPSKKSQIQHPDDCICDICRCLPAPRTDSVQERKTDTAVGTEVTTVVVATFTDPPPFEMPIRKQCTCGKCDCLECTKSGGISTTSATPKKQSEMRAGQSVGLVPPATAEAPPFEIPVHKACTCGKCDCFDCNKQAGTQPPLPTTISFAPAIVVTEKKPCTCGRSDCMECKQEGKVAPLPGAVSFAQQSSGPITQSTGISARTETKCDCPTCTCADETVKGATPIPPITITPGASKIPATRLQGFQAVASKSTGILNKEIAHPTGCVCPECCLCVAKVGEQTGGQTKKDEVKKNDIIKSEEIIKISQMDNETLMKKIQTDKQENCKCKEQIKEIRRALDKIKCSCTEAEMKAIRSSSGAAKPFVKQASAFGQTMSGLKFALNNLQEKCKAKDKLIEVMTGELKMRTSSNTFDKVLNTSINTDVPDFDKAEDVKPFERSPDNTTNVLFTLNEEREIGHTNVRRKSSEYTGHRHKKKSKVCKCGKQHKDRDNANVDLSGFEVVDIRRITQDSIIIKWKPPQSSLINGYDIFVNGVNKSKVMSGGRTSAMVHSLDLSSTIQITIYAVTKCGRCEPPAIAIYEINT